MNRTKYIAVFKNTREMIKADNICKDARLEYSVIPVPESISSECGMCILFDIIQKDELTEILHSKNIFPTVYERDKI